MRVGRIPVKRDRGTGKIDRPAFGVQNHFYQIRIGHIRIPRERRSSRGHLFLSRFQPADQGINRLRFNFRLIPLDIDDNSIRQ